MHAAARIEAAAHAREILVTNDTLDGVRTAFSLAGRRKESLKGFEEPVEVVSVNWR